MIFLGTEESELEAAEPRFVPAFLHFAGGDADLLFLLLPLLFLCLGLLNDWERPRLATVFSFLPFFAFSTFLSDFLVFSDLSIFSSV